MTRRLRYRFWSLAATCFGWLEREVDSVATAELLFDAWCYCVDRAGAPPGWAPDGLDDGDPHG